MVINNECTKDLNAPGKRHRAFNVYVNVALFQLNRIFTIRLKTQSNKQNTHL